MEKKKISPEKHPGTKKTPTERKKKITLVQTPVTKEKKGQRNKTEVKHGHVGDLTT